jgi:hypothetical protein
MRLFPEWSPHIFHIAQQLVVQRCFVQPRFGLDSFG